MSDKEKEAKKKPGLVKKLMIPLAAILVLGGGGAAAGFFFAGTIAPQGEQEDPNAPKVVLKDGSTVSAKEAGIAGAPTAAMNSNFKITYHKIEEPFTANLAGNTGFMQATLAVSTYYDERVIEALVEHDIAIRSAVILAISENDALTLESNDGKEKLKAQLKGVINDTLETATAFRGIEDVYFTSLVIQ